MEDLKIKACRITVTDLETGETFFDRVTPLAAVVYLSSEDGNIFTLGDSAYVSEAVGKVAGSIIFCKALDVAKDHVIDHFGKEIAGQEEEE